MGRTPPSLLAHNSIDFRSNGLLNIGYIGFRLLQDMMYYSDGEKYLWDESKAGIIFKVY